MFAISKTPLEQIHLKEGLESIEGGALATFEGRVRNKNEGKAVTFLEYDVFDTLAQVEGEKILKEAKEKFDIIKAKCLHRAGKLKIGEMAVWVGVVAGHRNQAFQGCRYIIDEIKKRVPIWKKEYYANGDSGWVNCHGDLTQINPEPEYYSRQTNLKDVGMEGQKKLKNARVLVIGAGGLGVPALLYLTSSGIGTIGIVDSDNLEVSNLHRQVLYSFEDVGKSKVELAAKRLKSLNPFIHIRTYPVRATAQNIYDIAQHYSLILDCSDNFPTKFLLNDFAVVAKIPLIQASVYQLEGQLLAYNPKANSACVRCLWPQVPDAACVGVCDTVGILGVVPGVFGTLQATEAIKYILNFPEQLTNAILVFDLSTYRVKKMKLEKNPHCPVCSNNATIKTITAENYSAPIDTDLDIAKLSKNEFLQYEIIDVRESSERLIKPVKLSSCVHVSSRVFEEKIDSFDTHKKYLLFCEKGLRSQKTAQKLRDKGILSAFSIIGGADAVKKYLKENHIEPKQSVKL